MADVITNGSAPDLHDIVEEVHGGYAHPSIIRRSFCHALALNNNAVAKQHAITSVVFRIAEGADSANMFEPFDIGR